MAMALTPPTPGGSPVDRFRAFYAAVAEARRRLEGGAWPPLDTDNALQKVQTPLLALLDRLEQQVAADPSSAEMVSNTAGKIEQLLANLGRPQALTRAVAVRENGGSRI